MAGAPLLHMRGLRFQQPGPLYGTVAQRMGLRVARPPARLQKRAAGDAGSNPAGPKKALPGRDKTAAQGGENAMACRGRADGTGNGQRKGGRWWILRRYWVCWIM